MDHEKNRIYISADVSLQKAKLERDNMLIKSKLGLIHALTLKKVPYLSIIPDSPVLPFYPKSSDMQPCPQCCSIEILWTYL